MTAILTCVLVVEGRVGRVGRVSRVGRVGRVRRVRRQRAAARVLAAVAGARAALLVVASHCHTRHVINCGLTFPRVLSDLPNSMRLPGL